VVAFLHHALVEVHHRRVPAQPKPIMVKLYPSYILLGMVNPFMYLLMLAMQGASGRLRSAAQEMDDDAVEMARRGYRIHSVEELETALIRMPYLRVTYELVDPPR
jgi:hypothetical protein